MVSARSLIIVSSVQHSQPIQNDECIIDVTFISNCVNLLMLYFRFSFISLYIKTSAPHYVIWNNIALTLSARRKLALPTAIEWQCCMKMSARRQSHTHHDNRASTFPHKKYKTRSIMRVENYITWVIAHNMETATLCWLHMFMVLFTKLIKLRYFVFE